MAAKNLKTREVHHWQTVATKVIVTEAWLDKALVHVH